MNWNPYWKKKGSKSASAASKWQTEYCASDALAARTQALAAAKWLVKYVYWDGVTPGQITIISMQSALYAPKPKKSAKKSAAESE